MNREIEFRSYNSRLPFEKGRSQEMMEFTLLDLDGDYIVSSGTYIDEDTIILQFTNLFDRNDKKIFEGDLVQIFSPDGTKAYIEDITDIYKAHSLSGVGGGIGSCEVIGNIYQNPELKKEMEGKE